MCHQIFIHISHIRRQFVTQKFLIYDVIGISFVPEGLCYKKSGISHKHLVSPEIFEHPHPNSRIIDMICHGHHMTLLHFSDGLRHPVGCLSVKNTSYLEAVGVTVQLAGDCGKYLCGIPGTVNMCKVICIKFKNFPLDFIHLAQIIILEIGINRLWHTANQHIQPDIPHPPAVHSVPHRPFHPKHLTELVRCNLVASGPIELFQIHGKQFNTMFLAGNQYVLDIFPD